MARNFGAAGRRLRVATTFPNVPLSMACWFRSTSVATTQCMMSVCVAGGADQGRMELRIVASAIIATTVISNGTSSQAAAGTSVTNNTWYHGAAVFAGTSSRSVYHNGGFKATQTTSRTITGTLSAANIGTTETTTSTFANPMLGDVAECGIWNVALTDGEVLELSTGVSPLKVRPDALIAYYRLIDADGDVDWSLQKNLTATGAVSYVQHPPTASYPRGILPRVKAAAGQSAAVPAGTVTLAGVATTTLKRPAVAVGTVTLAGVTPTARKPVAVTAGTVAMTGVTPAARHAAAVTVGQVTFIGVTPVVLLPTYAAVAIGTLTLTGVTPGTLHRAAVAVGTTTFAGIPPSIAHQMAVGIGRVSFTGVALTSTHRAAVGVGSVTMAGVLPATRHAAVAVAVGEVFFAGVTPDVGTAAAQVSVGAVAFTGIAPTSQHSATVPVGTLALGVTAQSEIQEVYFNGGTVGVLWLESASLPLPLATDISQPLATWQALFSSYGTVAAITGGLRFTFDNFLYTNRDIAELVPTIDFTNGSGVTVATVRQGSDGQGVTVLKRATIDTGLAVFDGVEISIGASEEFPIGTVTFLARAPTVLQGPSGHLCFGSVTVAPALTGRVRIEPALQGTLIVTAAITGRVRVEPALQGTVIVTPAITGIFRSNPCNHCT